MGVFDYSKHLDKSGCIITPSSFLPFMEGNIVTINKDFRKTIELLKKIAKTKVPIFLQGPSGVGKEVLADYIHNNSANTSAPFVKFNCAAIPEQLVESEFFGYLPGSFTGASGSGKKGLLELANNGALFLDEIAEMPLHIQAKLLRFLQNGKFRKVGGEKEYTVDVRIIAATNQNISASIKNGCFREDLFFRLNVVPVYLQPLKERKEDIPVLALYFLDLFNKQYNTNKRITYETMVEFVNYGWPGNARELRNTIERLVLITLDNKLSTGDLTYTHYISERYNTFNDHALFSIDTVNDKNKTSLKAIMEDLEKDVILKAVQKYGSIRKAADILQVASSTISRKISKYNKNNM